jgi:hypothetical protein
LYGGTAIALQCGHRVCENFNFFSAQALTPETLLAQVSWLRSPELKVLQRQDDTLTLQLEAGTGPVKLSFFGGIQFGQINPPEHAADNKLKIASPEDLLALKLGVIQQGVEAKDSLDIHALLKSGLSLSAGLSH